MTTAPVHGATFRVTDDAGRGRPARSGAPALDRVVERALPGRLPARPDRLHDARSLPGRGDAAA